MNKLTVIFAVIAGVVIGLIIAYMLKIPFAVLIVDTIKAKIASINIGGINIGSLASIASIAGLAGTAYQLIKTNKDKVAAQTENAKQLLLNQDTREELLNTTNIKTNLEAKLTEATQTLEAKTQEFKGMADEMTLLRNENDKLKQTIDTLHETLRRNKLTDGESIVKTVVK